MKDNRKNRSVSLLWVALGAVLTVCAIAGAVDSYWHSFGVALLVLLYWGSWMVLKRKY